MADKHVTIGVTQHDETCQICSLVHYIKNGITMDLLLSRKSLEELERVTFNGQMFTRDDFEIHAQHCHWSAVPDDYIKNPFQYESGEIIRDQKIPPGPTRECRLEDPFTRR